MAEKASKAKRKRLLERYEKVKKTSKPGSGKRFGALQKSIEAEGKSKEQAGAIAAAIGRKKYGKKKFAKMGKK
jgi:hypothetical protein